MIDHYAKSCQIESVAPQDISPIADFVTKSTNNQMSAMCVDYLTDQLAQAYIPKSRCMKSRLRKIGRIYRTG